MKRQPRRMGHIIRDKFLFGDRDVFFDFFFFFRCFRLFPRHRFPAVGAEIDPFGHIVAAMFTDHDRPPSKTVEAAADGFRFGDEGIVIPGRDRIDRSACEEALKTGADIIADGGQGTFDDVVAFVIGLGFPGHDEMDRFPLKCSKGMP